MQEAATSWDLRSLVTFPRVFGDGRCYPIRLFCADYQTPPAYRPSCNLVLVQRRQV